MKYSSDGEFLWEREYGSEFGPDKGWSIESCADGGLIIGGEYEGFAGSGRFWVLKTDSAGFLEWDFTPSFGGIPQDASGWCTDVSHTTDGSILAAGSVWYGGLDIAMINLDAITGVTHDQPATPDSLSLATRIYPNPFNAITTIEWYQVRTGKVKIDVYDILGRLVQNVTSKHFDLGQHRLIFNGQSLGSGSYFLYVQTPDYLYRTRLLLLK